MRDKVALPTTIDAVRARRIERALKSKMKLLHQSGPNCFIVQVFELLSSLLKSVKSSRELNLRDHDIISKSIFVSINGGRGTATKCLVSYQFS